MGKKLFESGYVKVSKPVDICRPTFGNLRSVALWCGSTNFSVDFSDSSNQKISTGPSTNSVFVYFRLGDVLVKDEYGKISVLTEEEFDEYYEKREPNASK